MAESGYSKTSEDIDKTYSATIGVRRNAAARPLAGGGRQDGGIALEETKGVNDRNTSEWTETEMINNRPTPDLIREVPAAQSPVANVDLGHGDVVIAAITACTNTSNPSVMLAAGLLAKKAVEKGLSVPATVKASLAPGSRVVTDYLEKTGLQPYLDEIGFNLAGYGCTTCIGNSARSIR